MEDVIYVWKKKIQIMLYIDPVNLLNQMWFYLFLFM